MLEIPLENPFVFDNEVKSRQWYSCGLPFAKKYRRDQFREFVHRESAAEPKFEVGELFEQESTF